MRRTRRSGQPRRAHGVTLIELVVAIVLMGTIVGATVYFLLPVRQAVDLTTRAELSDIADNSLQRMARDVRLALPNSVRVNGTSVEFLAVHTAGRYRADGYGAGTPPGGVGATCDTVTGDSDQLLFDASDDCFKPIGTVQATITDTHRLVLSNYGPSFAGQNAYASAASTDRNWRQIATGTTATVNTNDRIKFDNAAVNPFSRTLHDSPGRRFFIISGPVTYACDTGLGELKRHSGYAIQSAQPTAFATGDLIANNVTECLFEYEDGVAPQIGLLTVTLTLSKAVSGGSNETVRLFHAIHVRNIP